MRMEVVAIAIIASLVLAIIIVVAPRSTVMANETSGEIYGIDLFGLTNSANRDADEFSAQKRPAR